MNFLANKRNLSILTMPLELRKLLFKKFLIASPYNNYEKSGSFYNITEKTWNCTPDKTLRIADHWNFESWGKIHCKTDVNNNLIKEKWVLAEYDAKQEKYIVLQIYQKDHTAGKLRQNRRELEKLIDPLLIKDRSRKHKILKKLLDKNRDYRLNVNKHTKQLNINIQKLKI